MLKYLPAARELWGSIEEEKVGTDKTKVLWLSSLHSVSCNTKGGIERGRCDVSYKLMLRTPDDPYEGLNIVGSLALGSYDAPEIASYLAPIIGSAAERN